MTEGTWERLGHAATERSVKPEVGGVGEPERLAAEEDAARDRPPKSLRQQRLELLEIVGPVGDVAPCEQAQPPQQRVELAPRRDREVHALARDAAELRQGAAWLVEVHERFVAEHDV